MGLGHCRYFKRKKGKMANENPEPTIQKAINLLKEWVSDNGCNRGDYKDLIRRTKEFLNEGKNHETLND
jgi:hypothetical protein